MTAKKMKMLATVHINVPSELCVCNTVAKPAYVHEDEDYYDVNCREDVDMSCIHYSVDIVGDDIDNLDEYMDSPFYTWDIYVKLEGNKMKLKAEVDSCDYTGELFKETVDLTKIDSETAIRNFASRLEIHFFNNTPERNKPKVNFKDCWKDEYDAGMVMDMMKTLTVAKYIEAQGTSTAIIQHPIGCFCCTSITMPKKQWGTGKALNRFSGINYHIFARNDAIYVESSFYDVDDGDVELTWKFDKDCGLTMLDVFTKTYDETHKAIRKYKSE